MLVSSVIILVFISLVQGQSSPSSDTLELVHVVFRHGDRNPETNNLYQGDPYWDESHYQNGYGQLTNKGKLTAYRVGTALRQRYAKFLGETYHYTLIEGRSTDFNRTKATLQLVLAGLFPPVKENVWLEGFNWQPIPYNYVERQFDKELVSYRCPNWNKIMDTFLSSEAGKAMTAKYRTAFEILYQNTGMTYTKIVQLYYVFFGFMIKEELGIPLPDWAKAIYPHPINNTARDYYNLMFSTVSLRQISGGYLLKKIISDTEKKIKSDLDPPQRKMFLYSGHEQSIAAVMKILNVWNDENDLPPYGSYVLLEVHKIDGVYGMKVFYQDYKATDPVMYKIPTCGEFCPLNKLIFVVKDNIPADQSACGSVSAASTLSSPKKIPIYSYVLCIFYLYVESRTYSFIIQTKA